jgi:hypothetical protein
MKIHGMSVRQSGRWGGMVYVNSKHGQLARALPQKARFVTRARLRARRDCAKIAALWCTLSDDQMAGWHALAQQESLRLGKPASGYHLFTGINTARLALGLAPALDALKPVRFGPNPVQEFQITKTDGRLRLALRVAHTPLTPIVVLGSPPCSAGIAVRSNFSILGWLPPPVDGWSDLTRLYVQKFGPPADNQRVFIRVRQFSDGWQDLPREFQARMPRA